MKNHTKVYLKFFDYFSNEFIPCECCGAKAVDIHHIKARGMGGSSKDDINNLMAVCRKCHLEYGDKTKYVEWLQVLHDKKVKEQTARI